MMLRTVLVILLTCASCMAQLWSGVLGTGRAIDWTAAGVVGGIPTNRTQCGSTINAGASAATIQAAVQACAANHYVQLGAGTFNLTTGIDFGTVSNVTLRGMGADQTILNFSSNANCRGFGSLICIGNNQNPQMPTPTNTTTFTGTTEGGAGVYPVGATHLIVGTTSGMSAGNLLILDQLDDAISVVNTAGTSVSWVSGPTFNTGWTGYSVDINGTEYTISSCSSSTTCSLTSSAGTQSGVAFVVGDIFVCGTPETSGVTACTSQGQDTARRVNRGQQQMVTIVSVTDGTHLVVTPGLYMPNWRSSQSPGLSWSNSNLSGDAVENLSIDGTNAGISPNAGANIVILYASNCWVKGIRSIMDPRAHVWLYESSHNTVRDSYFYGTLYSTSTSYGVEAYAASADNLIENNIYDTIVGGNQEGGGGVGNVWGYNFSINDGYTTSANWMIPSSIQHATGVTYSLTEGNEGSGWEGDNIHGTHHFNTIFRSYMRGDLGEPARTNNTIIMNEWAFSRFYNIVGNVLGRAGYYNGYESGTQTSIYNWGQPDDSAPLVDPYTRISSLRWGNWDNVTNAIRWCGNSSDTGWSTTCSSTSEIPTGLTVYSNSVPTLGDTGIGQSPLPVSFYYSGQPSWWPNGSVWPPIGPDVSGGTVANAGGHVYPIPARNCWISVMGGTPGTSTLLSFNASTCYVVGSPTAGQMQGTTWQGVVWQ